MTHTHRQGKTPLDEGSAKIVVLLFRRFRKITTISSSYVSVCLSVHPNGASRPPLDGFL